MKSLIYSYILLVICWIACVVGTIKGMYPTVTIPIASMILIIGGLVVQSREQKGIEMDYEYNARVIINIFGTEVEINIPYLDEKPTKSFLREIILEDIEENLIIVDFDYTATALDEQTQMAAVA